MRVLTVDRFEQNFVICEDAEKRMFALEREEVPQEGLQEGDVLVINDAGEISVDREETKRRREKMKKLQNGLWK